jgi:OOP family OmpA-OmpF porin
VLALLLMGSVAFAQATLTSKYSSWDTDNVGGVDYSMKLSQARADAVVTALTRRYKVKPRSLKGYGAGQLGPVAPNKTEDGRAKNRRVELVEQ